MHPGSGEPEEERLFSFYRTVDKVHAGGQELIVGSLHPLTSHRSGVYDRSAGGGLDHSTRTVFLMESRILRIVVGLGLFLGVQVVKVAVEFVKTVSRGQMLVAVAEVVLSELAGDVPLLLEQIGHGRGPVRNTVLRARHADSQKAGSEGMLAHDEGRPTGSTALLSVIVGHHRTFFGEAVDVGGFITHHTVIVGTDVMNPDVIPPDNDNVRLLGQRR